ncbi:uncharacterized protein LOC130748853 [Lotus japonicus]|uniref:uncharacterized protein LOC130748853 n=1 Tax=Lotus japonicus TaxID=34305 RepID=UPI002585E3EE|nr:uncharacterized protein LOC130748853 [Lotus japonicus]
MSNPLPPIAKVVSLAMQHERQSVSEESEESKILVNMAEGKKSYGKGKASSSGSSSGYKNTGKYCTHCKKPGHTVEICYKLHGYPNTFKPKPASNNVSHANNVAGGFDSEDDEGETIVSQQRTEDLFTADQYKQIMAMIQQATAVSASQKHSESGKAFVNHVTKSAVFGAEVSGNGRSNQEEDWFG